MKIIKQVIKAMAIVFMIVSVLLSNATKVLAVSDVLTKGEKISYPSDWSDNSNWATFQYYYGDKVAYCIEASKSSPSLGTYEGTVLSNEELLKVLYYGFGGPGYEYALNHGISYISDDDAYVNTHIMASYAYANDLFGLDENTIAYKIIMTRYAIIQSFQLPSSDITIPTLQSEIKDNVQRTNTVIVEGSSEAYIQVSLPDDVTMYFEGDLTPNNGEVIIHGGDQIYFESSLENSGSWESGDLEVQGVKPFDVLGITTSSTSQQIGTVVEYDSSTTDFQINWLSLGAITITKVDQSNELLDGATFLVTGNNYEQQFKTVEGIINITNLTPGTYTVKEVTAPEGYVTDGGEQTIEVAANKTATAIFTNSQTTVEVSKQDIAGQELPGAQMQLFNSNGELIEEWVSTDNPHIIKGLIVGKNYTLIEEIAPDGYLKSSEVEFTVDNSATNSVVMVDELTKVSIDKVGTDGEFVVGATLQLIDEDNEVIEEWVSDKSSHVIRGLTVGNKYRIKEIDSPQGYITSEDMIFEVIEESEQKINFINNETTVLISKQDVAGNELVGAKMTLFDDEGNTIESWVSTSSPHEIRKLIVGEEYTLTEETAPLGYVCRESIKFVVDDSETQSVIMQDNYILVSKTNSEGENLKGASLQVVDENGEIIDQWESGQHIIDISSSDIELLEEGKSVTGELEDGDYRIKKNETGYLVRIHKDKEFSYYLVNVNGDETVHLVRGLEQGGTYEVIETKSPDGYLLTDSKEFKVGDENQLVEIIDKQTEVKVSKLNELGEAISGAKLQVLDQDGNLVGEWISDDQPHIMKGLSQGSTYVLHEVVAPSGYHLSEDIEFVVDDEKITMVDLINYETEVAISKQDITTSKELPGATLELFDEDGDLVESWVSTEEPYMIKKLEVGKEYILKETIAPNGYEIASDVKFTVSQDKGVQTVVMYDELIESDSTVVNTGDTYKLFPYITMIIVSTIGIFYIKKFN